MPRTHASRHATRTTASSGSCDRRPARDRVGDPRCCSRWGCNRGRERKPDMQAVVGAGCYPSLLPAISDRQLPFDGVMRMPREDLPTGRQAARVHWRRDLRARRARRCVDRSRPVGNVPAAGPDAPAHCPSSGASVWASDSSGVEASDSPAVNGHLFLPDCGHLFSPSAAMISLHWWPSFLPSTWVPLGSGQGLHPLAGGRLGEPVAVLAFGDQDVGVME
jgi:hypothetical protein